jgi:hypothetical protein
MCAPQAYALCHLDTGQRAVAISVCHYKPSVLNQWEDTVPQTTLPATTDLTDIKCPATASEEEYPVC